MAPKSENKRGRKPGSVSPIINKQTRVFLAVFKTVGDIDKATSITTDVLAALKSDKSEAAE